MAHDGPLPALILFFLAIYWLQSFVCSFCLISPHAINEIIRVHQSSLYSHADTYTLHWEALLSEEYNEAVADLRMRRKIWSRKRLEDMGLSIFNADAEPESDLFGEKIVRIVKKYETNLRDKFTRGEILVMTAVGRAATKYGNRAPMKKECCIVDVGSNWMTVAVGHAWPAGLWEARRIPGSYQVRLDRTAPRAPLKAQRQALELVRQNKAGNVATLMVETFCIPNATSKMSETLPRFKDLDSLEVEQMIAGALREATEVASFDPNESQKDAISWALGRRISLLQGPPGTGKTISTALLIATALRLRKGDDASIPPPRALAVAHSNGAADVLLEALLQAGVPAIRVGRPASVSASVRHRTVIAIANKHPEVVGLRQQSQDTSLESHVRSSIVTDTRQCLKDVCESIIKTAPVVVTSCIGAHQLVKEGAADSCTFPLVVVDEAAQTTEPALLCALASAQAEQLILVGDTRQLPPTIASESPELRNKLGVSPMSRLEAIGVGRKTLRVQYRMPPALLEHPSQYFYNGLVTCADIVKGFTMPKGFSWPLPDVPLAFIQSGPDLELTHEFGGKSNPTEAKVVVDVIAGMLQSGDVMAQHIAVITPYAKQVQRIRIDLGARSIRNVRVGTVDSFQGQETDLVVFSAVRSNLEADIGFLHDPRRLCVSITRARRGLILVGDMHSLRASRHWTALIDSCKRRGCIIVSDKLYSRRAVSAAAKKEACAQRQPSKQTSVEWVNVLFDD